MDRALQEEVKHAKRAKKPTAILQGRHLQGIAAASDGFWTKRWKSLTGSADVIGVETGKVLGVMNQQSASQHKQKLAQKDQQQTRNQSGKSEYCSGMGMDEGGDTEGE